MLIHDVPREYRHWVRHEGYGVQGAQAWQCFACALRSIPIGASRVVTDRLSHSSQFICRFGPEVFTTQNVDLDRAGWVVRQFGAATTIHLDNLPSDHHGPTCDHIDITEQNDVLVADLVIAAAERILKEARA